MPKMTDDELASHLQILEDDASNYVYGDLNSQREKALQEYNRDPYGNEAEGLSGIVTSEVQDTIESMLPELLDVFVSTDKAVVFEPSKQEDVKGAEQATDAINHVFYKQNNGFLVLYTAFKDALLLKSCAVMWRKDTRRTKVVVPANGATAEMLAMLLQESGEDAKIEQSTPLPLQPMLGQDGQPVIGLDGQPMMGEQLYNARISRIESKTTIKVEAFPPEDLLIQRDWTTPLLNDCPYVCRVMPITLSELHEMGYTQVKASDLTISEEQRELDRARRTDGVMYHDDFQTPTADESRTEGYLKIEYVLVDYDGDGISERRCIYRVGDIILKNEETSHVPFATASPILVQHRWDGISIAECVSDLQLLSTELTRQMVDSGRLALNPRTKVLLDGSGAPLVNIDDLLDSRAGGIVRQSRIDATTEMITPWVGGQMFPLLEYKDRMLEKRTGVTAQSQGLDPNSINRGGAYETKVMNAAQKRVKLIARIFAEILLKPTFLGILKTLTEGEMEKLAFRLRDEFVEYDPNEWRDQYDMTVNVGLGTGDRDRQTMVLQAISQAQATIAQSPLASMLLSPKQIYNTQARMVENAGFKNVGDFFIDPQGQQFPPPAPPAPDPKIEIEKMRMQDSAMKFQEESAMQKEIEHLKASAKLQEIQANLELQAANDERDSQREMMLAQHRHELAQAQLELDKYKTDADNRTKIITARIAHPETELTDLDIDPETGEAYQKLDPLEPVKQALDVLIEQAAAPKEVIRDEAGRVVGVQSGGIVKQIVRDEDGKVIGVQ